MWGVGWVGVGRERTCNPVEADGDRCHGELPKAALVRVYFSGGTVNQLDPERRASVHRGGGDIVACRRTTVAGACMGVEGRVFVCVRACVRVCVGGVT